MILTSLEKSGNQGHGKAKQGNPVPRAQQKVNCRRPDQEKAEKGKEPHRMPCHRLTKMRQQGTFQHSSPIKAANGQQI